jgi:hypothetical protein
MARIDSTEKRFEIIETAVVWDVQYLRPPTIPIKTRSISLEPSASEVLGLLEGHLNRIWYHY